MTHTVPPFPAVTAEQMREVDRLMVDAFGISLPQMMELAGRNLAELARQWLDGIVTGKSILVAAGKGHNGGGGLVAARHLSNGDASVTVLVESDAQLADVTRRQWDSLALLPVARLPGQAAIDFLMHRRADLVLDALIGYGLHGVPQGWTAAMIERLNTLGAPILALDVPSGLDATSGTPATPCVRAAATMTLALPKTGLLAGAARQFVGALYLADIGVPPVLYRRLGLDVGALFSHGPLVALEGHTSGARH